LIQKLKDKLDQTHQENKMDRLHEGHDNWKLEHEIKLKNDYREKLEKTIDALKLLKNENRAAAPIAEHIIAKIG